ncbi:hypothetical protein DFH06DRAFT_1121927 [Mycena polygramma]|nr:hypothetical protein DFH06DRAFT_1121927 [Mycena polygramma]
MNPHPADRQGPRTPDTLVDDRGICLRPFHPVCGRYPTIIWVPIPPQDHNRYDHKRYIEHAATDYILHPVARFIQQDALDEWVPHEHPEGAIYFKHRDMNVFTDEDVYDPEALSRINLCKEQILRRPQAERVLKSGDVDLVIEVPIFDQDTLRCEYYFADHNERLVFWIDDFSMRRLVSWRRMRGITRPTHVKLGLEIEYWQDLTPFVKRHVHYFPSSLRISGGIVKELRSRILFGLTGSFLHLAVDTMTSPTTTLPVPTEYIFRMLTVVDALETDREALGPSVTEETLAVIDETWGFAIGRFMLEFALARFINANGQSYARLDSETSIYGWTHNPSKVFILVSILLFNASRQHFNNIHTMYKDGNLNCARWKHFVRKIRSEWQETTLFGTLLLNANVGFLAISSGAVVLEPLARTLSYISVFFGLGSILTGMFLSRRYAEEDSDAGFCLVVTGFFARQSVIGFQSLAILYSLPYAFMVWGMIVFVFAFIAMAAQSVTGVNRFLALAMCAVVTVLSLGYLLGKNVVELSHRRLVPPELARRLRNLLPSRQDQP